MANLDEVFAAMTADADTYAVTDDVLLIDPDTRRIDVPESELVFGVESDTQSERKYFACPRYVGNNLDLASCFCRVVYRNANGEKDSYVVEDLAVNGEMVTFSWELRRKVVRYKGQVQFIVSFDFPSAGKEWHTTLASGTSLEGLETDDAAAEEATADVIAQLLDIVARQRAAVTAEGETQVAAVQAEGATQVAAVQDAASAAEAAAVAEIDAKGSNTLASIPADYTALGNAVDAVTRGSAPGIVCDAAGTVIQVQDASDNLLAGLRIFGRSTQDGTPTPDAPVEIVSVDKPVVTVAGKNLLSVPYKNGDSRTHGGLTYTVQADGGIHVTGTVTAVESYFVLSDFDFGKSSVGKGQSNGVYTWSDCLYNAPSRYTMLYFSQGKEVDQVCYPQVELGTEATEWEPPAGQVVTIASTLPGIPVSSGGNYTDADGQQWICDEVDFKRGVYVQRCFAETLNFSYQEELKRYRASLSWPADAKCLIGNGIPLLCDKYSYAENAGAGTPQTNGIRIAATAPTNVIAYYNGAVVDAATVLYPLATPIETPLSETELAAWRTLHSNKPCTTILNDAGAHMAAEYTADTKLYIDNAIARALG